MTTSYYLMIDQVSWPLRLIPNAVEPEYQSRVPNRGCQFTAKGWGIGGLIVTAVWLTDTSEDWGSLVETAAYYDNPFEYWAYSNNNNWPPSGANSKLTW